MGKKSRSVKPVELEKRLTKIERKLGEIINMLQDINLKLSHLIKQYREIFYQTG